MSLPSPPTLSYYSVTASSVDSMTDEMSETSSTGPQHIGQLDEPRELLNVIDQVHSTGVRADVDVPTICVLGDQSVGKSSVIEAISGIKLPRALDTCTRAVEVYRFLEFRYIEIHHIEGCQRSVRGVITDRFQVEERLRRAQRAVLSPNANPNDFLDTPEDECPPAELNFTSDYVEIEISDRDLTNLSFFDLPGLIANAETGKEGDIKLVEDLVSDYVSRDSCLVLLTIACECDFMTQKSYRLAQKYDPDGTRNIGVLTKPDRCPEGSEKRWLNFVRGKREPVLENGWFVVKRPDAPKLLSGITWEDAQSQEQAYFSTAEPWCSVDPVYRSNYGSQNLVRSLSTLLCELIKRRLPELQRELRTLLAKTRTDLALLPEPTKNPIAKASKIIGDFLRSVEKHLEGAPGKDGLHQSIRQPFVEFKAAIRASAPDFRPYPSSNKTSCYCTVPVLPYPDTAVNKNQVIYLDLVKELADITRARELPDHCPFPLLEDFANKFVETWEAPADALLNKIIKILGSQFDQIISQHFPDKTYPALFKGVKSIVTKILSERRDATEKRIAWQLESERKGIFTLNEEDLYSYKTSFVSACDDLHFSLSIDAGDPAVSIIGTVRGYFHVSHRRFLDNIPLAINQELIYGVTHLDRGNLHEDLFKKLGIDGLGAHAQCEKLLKEPANLHAIRQELLARYDRLTAAATALENAVY